MVNRFTFTLLLLSIVSAASAAPTTAPAAKLSKDQTTFFESKVRPILVSRCYKCHSVEEKKNKGGLTLDTRDGWKKGGENGAVIVAGDPAKSKLLTAVKYTDPELQMPPKGAKIADAEVAILEQWIKM